MTIGRIALLFCAAIWCACGAFALAALVGRARRAMRRCGVSARVVFLLAAAACVMLAGGKGGSVSVRDDYIQDAGSYLTNDVAHVAIAKRTPNLPDSTEILVYARELSSTNAADWFRLSPHLTFADHPYDYSLPNATNYSVLVSSSFVPEPTVHTNGVWALRGFEVPGHPGKYAFGNSRVRKDDPYDAEVEYLESTGTQWLDTGFKGNTTTTRFECSITLGSGLSLSGLFGSRNTASMANASSCNFFVGGADILFVDWPAATRANHSFTPGNYVISCTRGEYTINGVTTHFDRNESVDQDYNFLICSFWDGIKGPYTPSKARWRYARLYSHGTIIRDCIPVRVGNIGEMYDRVSGRFLERHGTFIVGPDKP